MQTANCPQEGGEMVGYVHTKRSPLYGVDSWSKCSEICQSQPDCQHWQWNENKECWSVKSFSSFVGTYNGVFAGAKSCPLTSQSLLTLCPTKGCSADMWMQTTTESDSFYDSETNLG